MFHIFTILFVTKTYPSNFADLISMVLFADGAAH